ncbi:hypothetical protein JAO29_10965 [Edaphobacter sp. HDX4]|uniref:hypothetical protein n=1 Tax=Edaphobacter sp. HDX4 TaxID=2794064 RepID=UPI002FE5FA49
MKFISTRICAGLTFSFLALCAESRAIHAYSLPSAFSGCRNFESCLSALDSKARTSDGSTSPDEEAIAAKLSTFGEPAKIELLRRAAGDNIGWRNLSQAILYNWKTWSPSDVPELQAALRRDPGGWMAKPLATIATPAAIEALVEDLPKGSQNQTDFALEKLGPRAVPALMPLLENAGTAAPAMRVIKSMGESVASRQVEWVQTAIDVTKPLPERLAALRAISALGSRARQSAASISSLAESTEPALRRQTISTLEAVQSFEQKFNERAQDVSIIELIANPLKYDGKQVQLIGFLRLEFEGNAIYLHQEDFEHAISRNAIWIDRPADLSEKQALDVNNRYIICQGTFKAGEHGHMGMFSGSLTHINRLEPWAVQ